MLDGSVEPGKAEREVAKAEAAAYAAYYALTALTREEFASDKAAVVKSDGTGHESREIAAQRGGISWWRLLRDLGEPPGR